MVYISYSVRLNHVLVLCYFLHSFIMWLTVSYRSLHNLHLQFCRILSIFALIQLVLMSFFCVAIQRDSVSVIRFLLLTHICCILTSDPAGLSDEKCTCVNNRCIQGITLTVDGLNWVWIVTLARSWWTSNYYITPVKGSSDHLERSHLLGVRSSLSSSVSLSFGPSVWVPPLSI